MKRGGIMKRQTLRKHMSGRYVGILVLGMALTALFLGGSAVAGVLAPVPPAHGAAFAAGSGPAPLVASCSTPGFNPASFDQPPMVMANIRTAEMISSTNTISRTVFDATFSRFG